jgi:hypothetical protein
LFDLLIANIIYVSYRLIVSGPIVKLLNKFLPFFAAVFIMAQASYAYDTFIFGYYFNATALPSVLDYLQHDALYTLRVLAAWWVIRKLWVWIGNYWIAVLLGAELTFICDYFIFKNLFH